MSGELEALRAEITPGIVREDILGVNQRPKVVDASAVYGGISSEQAAFNRRSTTGVVEDPAAIDGGGVVGKGALGHRQSGVVVDSTAIIAGGITGDDAV